MSGCADSVLDEPSVQFHEMHLYEGAVSDL